MQYKTALKIRHQSPMFLTLIMLALSFAYFLLLPNQVSAQDYKTDSCSTKINVDNCNAAVKKECTSPIPDRRDDCRKSVIGRFKDKVNDQTCSVKTYKEECETKVAETCTSTVPDVFDNCRKNIIASFADSTSSPEDELNDKIERQAAAFCGSDSASSPDGACRNGYRHGYRGDESMERACGDDRTVPYNTKEKKDRCKKGYVKGQEAKAVASGKGKLGQSGEYVCGTYDEEERNVKTVFDFGCLGTDFAASKKAGLNTDKFEELSPIMDMLFAVIRFLSVGIGIVITIALILSGIQYAGSEGNPEASAKAKKHVQDALVGLVIYIFAWSILQYLVPGGVFK